jgi:hypothetical protein
MNKIVTTKDMAQVLKICDSYLLKKYNIDIVGILKLNIDNKIEKIMMLLMVNEYISSLIQKYNFYTPLYELLLNLSSKKLFTISDQTLELSSSRPKDIDISKITLTESRLDEIFKSLEHNMDLFDSLYRDKIWIIDSSIGKSEKISISPTRFFHMIGLDEKDFKISGNLDKFSNVFNHEDRVKQYMTDGKDLFKVLELMLKREERVKEAILDGTLHDMINIPKIEMKNYSFERIGALEHSTGMVFFDKSIAESLNYKTRLQSDLVLLSDFIRKYDLDFVFSTYRPYNHNLKGKDSESVIISGAGGENSMFLNGQVASISEKASLYLPRDFKYSIKVENGRKGNPSWDPVDIITFSDEDKAKMAATIIEALPNLNTEHLKLLYKELQEQLNNTKRK